MDDNTQGLQSLVSKEQLKDILAAYAEAINALKSSSIKVVKMTLSEYKALTAEQQEDPSILYAITDIPEEESL